MTDLEIKLSEEILEGIPPIKEEMIRFLAKHFDSVIDAYNIRLRARVAGPMGGPLSTYERAIIKDFLIDITLGKLDEPPPANSVTLAA